jgi:hypothetical protein
VINAAGLCSIHCALWSSETFFPQEWIVLTLQHRRRQGFIGMPLHCCIWSVNHLTSGASSFLWDTFVVQADSSKIAPKLIEVKKKRNSVFEKKQRECECVDWRGAWLTGGSFLDAFAILRKRLKIYQYEQDKANYSLLMFFRPHETTRSPLEGFSRILVVEYFSKICRQNSSFITIWQT